MFGMENEEVEGQEQDPKSQVLQEILDFAQSKMLGKMKGKAPAPEGLEVSIAAESPDGMEAESEPTDGTGSDLCPHCGKSISGKAC